MLSGSPAEWREPLNNLLSGGWEGRFVKRLFYTATLSVVVGALALWLVGAAVSAPVNVPVGAPPAGLRATVVHFPSDSEATIAAWYGAPPAGGPTIVLSHGVRGSRKQLSERAQFIRDAGYGVLLYDAQGHGESIGSNITFGFLEAHDAAAAVKFIRDRSPNSRVGFIGLSLGGASALLGESPLPVEALVLEAVYPSLKEAVVNRISMRLGSFLAPILSQLLLWQVEPRLGFDPFKLNPIDRIGRVTAPIFLIAGSEDRHTSLEESKALFQAAGHPKDLWVVNGAAHQSFHRFAGAEYERRLLEFFDKHLGGTAAQQGAMPRVIFGRRPMVTSPRRQKRRADPRGKILWPHPRDTARRASLSPWA